MARTVEVCKRCKRVDPAHVGRLRKGPFYVLDKLRCLGCGAEWVDHYDERERYGYRVAHQQPAADG